MRISVPGNRVGAMVAAISDCSFEVDLMSNFIKAAPWQLLKELNKAREREADFPILSLPNPGIIASHVCPLPGHRPTAEWIEVSLNVPYVCTEDLSELRWAKMIFLIVPVSLHMKNGIFDFSGHLWVPRGHNTLVHQHYNHVDVRSSPDFHAYSCKQPNKPGGSYGQVVIAYRLYELLVSIGSTRS